jgi:hypothetical protein
MSQFSAPESASNEFNVPTEPPAWPKVVGIISIVLGSLGTVCGLCIAVFTFSMGAFMQKMGELQQQGQAQGGRAGGPMIPTTPMPPEFAPGPLSMVSAVFWPLGTILLIIAGIATVKRAANGRPLHLGYAGASLLFTLIGLVGAFMYQSSSHAFLAAHPDDPWSQFFSSSQGGMQNQIPQAVGMTCFSAIYPIFCIVWFGPLGKRPEAGAPLPEPLM